MTVHGSAVFSESGLFRYRLKRSWLSASDSPCLFVCLNPSTADAVANDATVRRMIGFAMGWGHSDLLVGNVFAYRAIQPRVLRGVGNPVGADNDEHLADMASQADRIVAAWGADWMVRNWPPEHTAAGGTLRARKVYDLLAAHGTVECLGTTLDHHPLHPLRLARTTPLEPLTSPFYTQPAGALS